MGEGGGREGGVGDGEGGEVEGGKVEWEMEGRRGRGEEGGKGQGGAILDKVMDDDGVRRGQQSLQAARNLGELHPRNLKNLQDNQHSQALPTNTGDVVPLLSTET